MHHTIQALKNALVHAKFDDVEIESATDALIFELGEDLDGDEVTYIPGGKVDAAESALQVALNEADDEDEDVEVVEDDDDADDGEGEE